LWILLAGLAGLFLIPQEVRLWCLRRDLRIFQDPVAAIEFIRVLWQVEASVLALSITVIIFAFQAVFSYRRDVKLYEFAEDIHLFPVFYVGVVGLILDGLVLLGVGNGAPGGSAASWVVIVSGSSFPLLAMLFTRTVRALDPDKLHRRRLTRIREEAHKAAELEIFERIAQNVLVRRCEETGIEFSPFFAGSPPAGSRDIIAPLSGYVADINLKKLESLTEDGSSGVKLLVYVGARVAKGRVIIVLPPSATEKSVRRSRQVVRIEEDGG